MEKDFSTITIDIETMANQEAIKYLPEPEAAKNLKDPVKIAEDLERKRQDQLEKMALDALYGKVICIAVTNGKSGHCWCDTDEGKILQEFFDFLHEKKVVQLITFNGYSFDLPFLYRRAVINGIQVFHKLASWGTRFSTNKHFDVMQVWGNYKDYVSLDSMAKIFFGKGKNELDYREFPELMKTQEGQRKIMEYCAHDASLTFSLYQAICNIF